jgi:serralysin
VRIEGSVSTPTDKDFYSVHLREGELLILDVDGTVTLDSFLRLHTITGSVAATSDDLGTFDPGSTAHAGVSHNMDSFIRFRAPTTGDYNFSIEAFDQPGGDRTSGAYKINVSIGPPASAADLQEEDVEALLSGYFWSDRSLTFGFPTSPSQYPPGSHDGEPSDNFGAFNAVQQAAVRQILGQFAQLTDLAFTENSGSPGSASLRYAMSDAAESAYAYYPTGGGQSGTSWYNNSSGVHNSPGLGNYAWLTLIHETGHSLGLKHGHEAPALSFIHDSLEYSVMTYRSYVDGSLDETSGFTNETFGYPQSLMMYDMAALQRLYGADFTFNGGNTVYRWSPDTGQMFVNDVGQLTPGANRVFLTVWDGGGTDTYDLSGYGTEAIIDLRPGEWTITARNQLADLGHSHLAEGNVANALLYNEDVRSLIENAIGGSGNDILIANQAVNLLTGGPGADAFRLVAAADSPTAAPDKILDFLRGADKIDLSWMDGNTNLDGHNYFGFIGTDGFSGTSGSWGEVRYELFGSDAHVFGDFNADALADFELVVAGIGMLDRFDFMFGYG